VTVQKTFLPRVRLSGHRKQRYCDARSYE